MKEFWLLLDSASIAMHVDYCGIFKSVIMCVLFLTHNYSTDFSAFQILIFGYSK